MVNAGGLGIVIAYAIVAWSFLVLRKREPELSRPYRIRYGRAVGLLALTLSVGLIFLYLPGSPSALIWPQEWAIFIGWSMFGLALFLSAQKSKRLESDS